jgi:hypothetical protein
VQLIAMKPNFTLLDYKYLRLLTWYHWNWTLIEDKS